MCETINTINTIGSDQDAQAERAAIDAVLAQLEALRPEQEAYLAQREAKHSRARLAWRWRCAQRGRWRSGAGGRLGSLATRGGDDASAQRGYAGSPLLAHALAKRL